MRRAVEISSGLPAEFAEELEALLCFNPSQERARRAVEHVIEKYGTPRLLSVDGLLRVVANDPEALQTLFALVEHDDGWQLAGVVTFLSEEQDLVVLHLAVDPVFSSGGSERDLCIALRLLQAVRRVAQQLKGITGIITFYPSGAPWRLPASRTAERGHPPQSALAGTRTPAKDIRPVRASDPQSLPVSESPVGTVQEDGCDGDKRGEVASLRPAVSSGFARIALN